MTAPADPPGVDAVRAPPQQGRRHPAVRWIVHGVLLVALTVGIFGLLPRLGGLTRDAAGLRHARPAFLVAAVAAEAVSLGCYAQLYRRVLAALGARIRFRLAADVIMATFFVSHLTPFGSATGTLVNASALESEGIAATTTGEAIALSSLTSTVALIALFGSGFAATAGQHVSRQYLVIAGVALFLVLAVLAAVLAVGARPAIAGRAGRWVASVARHVRPSIDPAKAGQTSARLASLARTALTGRDFAVSFVFAAGNWLCDLLALDLVFVALHYQPGFGSLAVAYGAANVASAIPLTPGGLGVIEVTLVAITVGFGAPRPTAVLAVLGYRIANYWLPLIPGAIAYIRLRLRPGPGNPPRARRRRTDDGGPARRSGRPRWCAIGRPHGVGRRR
jgi:uncharacterized protein (TIRG00374 family)